MKTRIKELLAARGMKVKDLAEALGVAPEQVSMWSSGARKLTARGAEQIAAVLGVSVAELSDCTTNHDLVTDLQRRLAICEAQLAAKDAEIAALHQTLRVGLAGKQNPKKPIRKAS